MIEGAIEMSKKTTVFLQLKKTLTTLEELRVDLKIIITLKTPSQQQAKDLLKQTNQAIKETKRLLKKYE